MKLEIAATYGIGEESIGQELPLYFGNKERGKVKILAIENNLLTVEVLDEDVGKEIRNALEYNDNERASIGFGHGISE